MPCLCDRDEVNQWNGLNDITYFLEKTNESTWAGGLLDSWETTQRGHQQLMRSQSYLQAWFVGTHNESLPWSHYTLIQLHCLGLRLIDSGYSRQFLIVDISHLREKLCSQMWPNDLKQEHCLKRKCQHSRRTVFVCAWLCASVVCQLTLLLLFKNSGSIKLGINDCNYFTKESTNYKIQILNQC